MADVGLAVSCGRAVIENIALALFAAVYALFKDAVLVPEFFDLFFSLNKVQISVHFFVHNSHPFVGLLDGRKTKKAPVPKRTKAIGLRKPPIQHTIICVPDNAGKKRRSLLWFGAQLIK